MRLRAMSPVLLLVAACGGGGGGAAPAQPRLAYAVPPVFIVGQAITPLAPTIAAGQVTTFP